MKKEWFSAALLSLACLILLNGGYTLLVWGLAQLSPQKGLGERISGTGGRYYYANIAQNFHHDQYFSSRPSAVGYNAAGSGGSNKGPFNPDYLNTVRGAIDSFRSHNPGIGLNQIPSDLVTASGSGLDPDISVDAALVQVNRISRLRGIAPEKLIALVQQNRLKGSFGLAPEHINILRLNLALDQLK